MISPADFSRIVSRWGAGAGVTLSEVMSGGAELGERIGVGFGVTLLGVGTAPAGDGVGDVVSENSTRETSGEIEGDGVDSAGDATEGNVVCGAFPGAFSASTGLPDIHTDMQYRLSPIMLANSMTNSRRGTRGWRRIGAAL